MQCALDFVFVVGTVEPHCVFRGGANYSIAPPPERQPSRRIRNTYQPNLGLHYTTERQGNPGNPPRATTRPG